MSTNLDKKRRKVELGIEGLHIRKTQIAAELAHAREEMAAKHHELGEMEKAVRRLEGDLEVVEELLSETSGRLQHLQSPLAEVVPQGQVVISSPRTPSPASDGPMPNPRDWHNFPEWLDPKLRKWAQGRGWFGPADAAEYGKTIGVAEAAVAGAIKRLVKAKAFESNGKATWGRRYRLVDDPLVMKDAKEHGERMADARQAGLV